VQHQIPAALILITDLERRPQVLGRRLVELFGFTAAEACLAVALVAGKLPEEQSAYGPSAPVNSARRAAPLPP
jgi:hypothetical protein